MTATPGSRDQEEETRVAQLLGGAAETAYKARITTPARSATPEVQDTKQKTMDKRPRRTRRKRAKPGGDQEDTKRKRDQGNKQDTRGTTRGTAEQDEGRGCQERVVGPYKRESKQRHRAAGSQRDRKV